jgi:hypothetical protein
MAPVNYNAIMLIGGLARLAVTFSSAQVTGEIRGVVLDDSGGVPSGKGPHRPRRRNGLRRVQRQNRARDGDAGPDVPDHPKG